MDSGWVSSERPPVVSSGSCGCSVILMWPYHLFGDFMKEDLVFRLRKRAEIRRQIDTRKSVQNNEPDRIADLLEEAANEYKKVLETMEKYKKVLIDIANDYPELSHDKARMQNLDHIKWAKEALK